MYIETNSYRYRCIGYPVIDGETLCFTLPEGGPDTLGPTVGLYADDGFELHPPVEVGKFLRWGMEGDNLVITNKLEPEPIPEPEPVPPITEITTDQLAQTVVDMMFDIDQMKLNGGIVK